MLDLVKQETERVDSTFLNPATKSGVFLREVAKRLMKGLEKQIPDLQERVDYIFQKQLFGIAITEITVCWRGEACIAANIQIAIFR